MYNIFVTDIGKELQSKSIVDKTAIKLTTLAVGNGTYDDSLDYSFVEFKSSDSSLVNEIHRVNSLYVLKDEYNTNSFIINAILNPCNFSYWISEVALYDSLGNIFAIGSISPIFIPEFSIYGSKEVNIKFTFSVFDGSMFYTDTNVKVITTRNTGDKELLSIGNKFNFVYAINSNYDDIGDDSLLDKSVVDDINKNYTDIGNINDLKTANSNSLVAVINELYTNLLPIGKIELLPFDENNLPKGWYLCDGKTYDINEDIGNALNSLSINYKNNWSISFSEGVINIPNLFNLDERGFFIRPVIDITDNSDNIGRKIGSIELDSFKSHSHTYNKNRVGQDINSNGSGTYGFNDNGPYHTYNSSTQSNAFSETSPMNIGMLPCIYLGV